MRQKFMYFDDTGKGGGMGIFATFRGDTGGEDR
jgi:hypothetical protein